jgi:hypothetical protein
MQLFTMEYGIGYTQYIGQIHTDAGYDHVGHLNSPRRDKNVISKVWISNF